MFSRGTLILIWLSPLLAFTACNSPFGGTSSSDADFHPGKVRSNSLIEVTPLDTNPPSVLVGAIAIRKYKLANLGQRTASVISSTVSGAAAFAGGYPGTGGSCGTEIVGLQSCTLVISVTAENVGTNRGGVVLSFNDGKVSPTVLLSVSVTGTLLANTAILDLTATVTAFAPTLSGNTSASLLATVTNNGSGAATLIAPSSLGSQFIYAGGIFPGTGGNCGTTLAAGSTCSIFLAFSPMSPGSFTLPFALTYFDGQITTSSNSLSFSGNTQSSILIAPPAYPNTAIGTQIDGTFTLSNNGGISAIFGGASLVGIPNFSFDGHATFADYGTGTTCTIGGTIPPGGSCNITVTFAPLANSTPGTAIPVTLSLQLSDALQGSLTMTSLTSATPTPRNDPGGTSFNTFGPAFFTVPTTDLAFNGSTVQTDGKIVAVGGRADSGSVGKFVVARYLANGGIDTAFGSSGKLFISTLTGGTQAANSVLQDPLGKLYVAGTSRSSGANQAVLVRLTPSGVLDPTFGTAGVAAVANSYDISAAAVVRQSDGKIIIVGGTQGGPSGDTLFAARFLTNGTLDSSYGAGGIISPAGVGGTNLFGYAGALQDDGKLIIAGKSNAGGNDSALLMRIDSTGNIDTAFNGSGKVLLSKAGSDLSANSVVIQPDNQKITIGGSEDSDSLMARFNTVGNLDSTFNAGGPVPGVISIVDPAGNTVLRSIVEDPAGRFVGAGTWTNGGVKMFFMARVSGDGTLDTIFGAARTGIDHPVFPTDNNTSEANSVCLNRNTGKFFLSGYTSLAGEHNTALAAFNP